MYVQQRGFLQKNGNMMYTHYLNAIYSIGGKYSWRQVAREASRGQ